MDVSGHNNACAWSTKKWGPIIILLNASLFCCLLTYEIYNPESVLELYSSKSEFFLDLSIAMVLGLGFMGVAIYLFIQQYENERKRAITQALKLEKQHQELSKLNEEKTKLISIVSHDFRAPLASLETKLNFTQEKDFNFSQFKKEFLAQSRDTTNLITNLLIWANNQLHDSKIELEKVNLSQIAQTVYLNILPQADQKKINLSAEITDDTLIFGDAELLKLVIRNLLNNAIKFTPEGGDVTLSISKIDGANTIVDVKDSGIGISQKKLTEISLGNVSSDYGTNYEAGVGLGLKICNESLAKMNSKLEIKTIEKEGSSFSFSIPLSEP